VPAVVRLIETFDPTHLVLPHDPRVSIPAIPDALGNALYHGDNLPMLAHLREAGYAGRFRLIYADPPYDSGVDWTRKVRLRGPKAGSAQPVVAQQLQYTDDWEEGEYLQFLYVRLQWLCELLAEDGSLWLHCDHRHAHHLRCLLDEIFGAKNYLNTITWRSQTARGAKVNAFYFPNSAHTILVFAKNRAAPTCWNPPKKSYVLTAVEAAAEFMHDKHGFFRTSDPGTYSFESLQRLDAEGRLYAPYGGAVVLDEAAQRVYCTNGGNIGVKYYLAALGDGRHAVERAVDNIWDDIPGLGTTPSEDLGYPTQKTEALLERIVATATRPGDWVLDPFAGSGTTLAVAQKLGRRWIGGDAALGAVQTAARRLQTMMVRQHADRAQERIGNFAIYRDPDAVVPPPAGTPRVALSITPIGGEPARIRIVVEDVGWPSHDGGEPLNGDWRTAVDSIVVDPAFDGQVLRVAMADAPPKRKHLVTGVFTMPAPTQPTTIAVRVTDVWGRDSIVTQEI